MPHPIGRGTVQVPVTDYKQPDTSTFIDLDTFDQILEMDDEGDDSFSKGIVVGFVEQAATTFEEMEKLMFVPASHFNLGQTSVLTLVTAPRRTLNSFHLEDTS